MDSLGLLFILFAYLLGSVSSAILVCQLFGYGDPRESGSGNPGTTNVLRIGGKKAALLTLLGDMLKGFIPVALALWMQQPQLIVGVTGLAAFIGHLFPVFFRFKGGKGVATFLGVILIYNIFLGFYAVICWLICAWAFRISSLSALITAITLPFFAWFFYPQQFVILLVMSALLIIRHHENIKKLLQGKESNIGQKD